jgi:hypothetical protein
MTLEAEIKYLNGVIEKFNNPISNPTEAEADYNFTNLQNFKDEVVGGRIVHVGYYPNDKYVINREVVKW